jgi:hypothetical protein
MGDTELPITTHPFEPYSGDETRCGYIDGDDWMCGYAEDDHQPPAGSHSHHRNAAGQRVF